MSEPHSGVYSHRDFQGRHGFDLAGRSTYLRVDLSAIWHNLQILKAKCHEKTKVMAVVKANAYGHGSVGVSRFLYKRGVRHFAVATASEGKELRENGIEGYIQVFGNCVTEEIPEMYHYNLTPTSACLDFLDAWDQEIRLHDGDAQTGRSRSVVVKLDTGMSRNGCQSDELPSIMQKCEELSIPVHSIMTHFAQSWDDPEFTQRQFDLFLEAVEPYRSKGVKLHVANSAAILHGVGTDLDFIRPGIAMYGQTIDCAEHTVRVYQSLGFRPALAWLARPSMVKHLQDGRAVGYDQTYTLPEPQFIATFRFGYADGYNHLLSNKGIVTDEEGNEYKVVGIVSMDAVTAQVTSDVTEDTVFYVIKDDYTSVNCSTRMALDIGTITYEIIVRLCSGLVRVFVTSDEYCSEDI